MAKAPAGDSIMAPDKMKPLLALSKREPVQAAIGLTSDGEGIILLDKRAKPKKVFSMLKASAAKAKLQLNTASLRFGRAEVDTDYDSGTIRFFINKEAPGNLRIRLVEVAKRIPYQKIEINVDPSLELEPEDDGEMMEADATGTPPEAAAAIPPAPPIPPEAAATPPPAPPLPPADLAALRAELGGLIRRIPAAAASDPSRLDGLRQLATDANTALKEADATAAAAATARLRTLLDGPAQATSAAPAASPAGPVAYAKSRLAWLAVRKQMEGDIDKLRAEMLAFYGDSNIVSELNRNFSSVVEPVLSALDESLADILDDATNETDPGKRAALVAEARATIARYQAFMGSEPLFQELDGNPFVPLNIAATLTRTLAALAAAVH